MFILDYIVSVFDQGLNLNGGDFLPWHNFAHFLPISLCLCPYLAGRHSCVWGIFFEKIIGWPVWNSFKIFLWMDSEISTLSPVIRISSPVDKILSPSVFDLVLFLSFNFHLTCFFFFFFSKIIHLSFILILCSVTSHVGNCRERSVFHS